MFRIKRSLEIFGDYENYTFLESLELYDSEKQCCQFFQYLFGRHLGFSKWPLFFLKIWHFSACNKPIDVFLVSTYTFLRSMNWGIFFCLFSNNFLQIKCWYSYLHGSIMKYSYSNCYALCHNHQLFAVIVYCYAC